MHDLSRQYSPTFNYDNEDYEYENEGDVLLGNRGGDYENCDQEYDYYLGGGLETKRRSHHVECSLELTHGAINDVLSGLETQRFSGKRT